MTLGEWVREVLLERRGAETECDRRTVLAETLALRTFLLNAFYKLAQGDAGAHQPGRRGEGGESIRTARDDDSRERKTYSLVMMTKIVIPMFGNNPADVEDSAD